jgi:hypothetical protein
MQFDVRISLCAFFFYHSFGLFVRHFVQLIHSCVLVFQNSFFAENGFPIGPSYPDLFNSSYSSAPILTRLRASPRLTGLLSTSAEAVTAAMRNLRVVDLFDAPESGAVGRDEMKGFIEDLYTLETRFEESIQL